MIKEQSEIEKALEILKKQGYEVKEPKPKTFTLQELSDELKATSEAVDDIVTLFNTSITIINENFNKLSNNLKLKKDERFKALPKIIIDDDIE